MRAFLIHYKDVQKLIFILHCILQIDSLFAKHTRYDANIMAQAINLHKKNTGAQTDWFRDKRAGH